MLYGAHECAGSCSRRAWTAVERHRLHGTAMLEGVGRARARDVRRSRAPMHNVIGVGIPDGSDGDARAGGPARGLRDRDRHVVRPAARPDLAHRHDGLQRRRDVLHTLAALEQVLRAEGHPLVRRARRGGARRLRGTHRDPSARSGRATRARRACSRAATSSRRSRSTRLASSRAPLARAPPGERARGLDGSTRALRPGGRGQPAAAASRARATDCPPCCSARTSTPCATRTVRRHARRAGRDRGVPRRMARRERVALPFALQVVGFRRRGGPPVRQRAPRRPRAGRAASIPPGGGAEADGITLREAFRDFGLDPVAQPSAARAPDELVGYLEAHIEQGPHLEEPTARSRWSRRSRRRRFELRHRGHAGHAGAIRTNVVATRSSARASSSSPSRRSGAHAA